MRGAAGLTGSGAGTGTGSESGTGCRIRLRPPAPAAVAPAAQPATDFRDAVLATKRRFSLLRARLVAKEKVVPLYEYVCRKCSKQFEELIFGADVPTCPACESTDVERILSVVAVGRSQPMPEPSACDSCSGRGRPGCGMN